jgi:hypothetical protein
MGTATAARRTPSTAKKTVKRTPLHVVRTPKKRVKERQKVVDRFEVDRFGRPPRGATHLQLRRMHANGTHDRVILSEGGFEQDKFPLARVSADWVRRTFGAGHYRGNWFARVDGKWKALGQMQELRMSSSAGAEVRAEHRPRRTVGFPFAVPAAAAAPEQLEEDRVVINARVRAEREIAEMRIRTMGELERLRLDGMREEHDREMRRLEARMEELSRRRRREEEEEDEESEEEEDRGPPGPWDFLAPLVQQAVPMIQEALPALVARWMGAAPPLPEAKKG